MFAVSERFKAACLQSHQAVAKVEILNPDNPEQVLLELPISNGSVTVDRGSSIRRRAQVTAIAPDLVPLDMMVTQDNLELYGRSGDRFGSADGVYGARERTVTSGVLAPYGTEFRVWRGIVFADGTEEMVPVGTFRLAQTTISDSGAGLTMQLTGYDRSRRVQRARWTEPYVIASGTLYVNAIVALLLNRYPSADVDTSAVSSTATTPLLVFGDQADNDPWNDAQTLAGAIGCELVVDADGRFVLRPEPDGTAAPVWTISEGENGTVVSTRRVLSDDPGYNGVIVTGEAPELSQPVRGEAWDDNPASPTFRGGPYGEVPRFYASPLMTSVAMAQAAAVSMLDGLLGADEEVEVDIVPMPALDVSDVVEVVRRRSNLHAAFLVESLTIPLGADGTMSVSLRRRRA